MSFSAPTDHYRDILTAIEHIEQFTSGMDADQFAADPKTVAAVERKLQIISEAAIRLGSVAEAEVPNLPWRNIRGIGNWLRHQYDRIDLATVWKTITDDLPSLKKGISLRVSNPK